MKKTDPPWLRRCAACHYRITALLVFTGLISLQCASQGLVTKQADPALYPAPRVTTYDFDHNARFAIYGDSRPGWVLETFLKKKNWTSWRLIGAPYWLVQGIWGGVDRLRGKSDYGRSQRQIMRKALLAANRRQAFEFILGMGDFITDGRQPHDWQQFLIENRRHSELLNTVPFVPVVGNHERVNDSRFGKPNYQAVFESPQFYTLEFPNTSIFVVDSDYLIDQYHYIPDDSQQVMFEKWFAAPSVKGQQAWLEKKLANCRKIFKIAVMHHPPVSFGMHHADWFDRDNGTGLIGKLQRLLDLFHRQGVQLIFASHEHFYEHLTLERADSKIALIISGGGGVPLRTLPDSDEIEQCLKNYAAIGVKVVHEKTARAFHYAQVAISANAVDVVVNMVNVSRKGEEILDQFRLVGK